MTDAPAPNTPEEPAGGPQSAEQPTPSPRVEPAPADASGGRTASPAERAALTELIALTEDMGLYEDRQPTGPDAARYARWLAVVRADRGLDPAIAHEITAAAIREADDEHTGIQLACAEQAARAEAHLEGVSAEADGWQRKYEQAERRLAQLRARSDRHVYLSTGCLHGQHGYCQGKNGLAGPKTPAQCKFCAAPCVCDCHHRDEPAVPAGGSDQRRQPYRAALYAAAMHETAYEGTEWADVRMEDRVRFLNTADAVMAVADAETAQLRAQLDTQTEKAGDCAEMAKDQRRRADALAERLHATEAALDRVHQACATTPPCIPGSQAEDVAHSQGWNAAMDHILAALVGPAEPGTNRRDKDADLRAALDRVRAAIAERRTEVAEYEAEQPPSAWSDAVTVTCDRIEDALRQPAPSPGVVLTDPQQQ
ncbi:hypothetical protein LUW77_03280 [Streptomyces radiopugnans]|nr:hypothetical protein LUW77_03280 [Streptomyces radiopugnans]